MSINKQSILAGILSVFDAGLGHIYKGKIKIGLILYFAYQVLLAVSMIVSYSSFDMLAYSLVFLIVVRVVIIIHSIYLPGNQLMGSSSIYGKWSFYTAFIILSIFFNVLVANILEPLKTYDTMRASSVNMLPTINDGDMLVGDMNYYSSHNPARGEVVVFHPPNNPDWTHIARIVGTPGDIVECIEGSVYRNNQLIDEEYLISDKSIQFEKIVVPEGSYFILGDNRTDSFDSRHYGFVKKENIIGKALYIYFSNDFTHIGNSL